MSSPHRPLNPRSGLVLDTHELGRRAGAMKVVRASVEAPADLGISVIEVPRGSPVELDLRLESVVEGVLVSGSATVKVRGECVRCLGEISDEMEVDKGLSVYQGRAGRYLATGWGRPIDLEPLLRARWGLICHSNLMPGDCSGLCPNAAPTSRQSYHLMAESRPSRVRGEALRWNANLTSVTTANGQRNSGQSGRRKGVSRGIPRGECREATRDTAFPVEASCLRW